MSDFKLVTVATNRPTQPYYTYDEFFKSIKGSDILILDREYTRYGGLSSKPKGVYRAIKEGLINTEFLMFTDCFDLVFQFNPLDTYTNYRIDFPDHPIVISAEKNCFPGDLKDEYDKLDSGGSPYKYLNSGFIIGKTKDILSCLESMDLPNVPDDHWSTEKNCMVHPNDQFLWMETFLKQPAKIVLDYKQAMSQTMHDVNEDEVELSGGKLRNVVTGEFPCTIHFNGGSKTGWGREKILKELNLMV
jgi:hypothetical protein